ncbi:YdcF family protein [Paenibacillus woosongensis]|uniref:Multidrug MFS transporter n=1 Tax=Paenibacillus woosongensis TaxID=307580 RepID=A0ABQ4MTW2_9BACL|nr:YdcF family protein [Paenibacillus woosongensis]GIP59343.1 multidrug MFS transporter [Paenibacillus woosongensis]
MIRFGRRTRNRSYLGMQDRRKRRPLYIRLLRWGIVFAVLCVCWFLYVLAQIGSVERSPALATMDTPPADVGIVLGAAMWGDRPSPGLEERLRHSLKQYEAGKFKMFLLTGGLDQEGYKYTEAEGMANYLAEHGVPREAMLLENEATSTYENLKFSQEIMKEHGLVSALIMTHTFHGNRSIEIANALNYQHPKLSLTKSNVLKPVPNTLREVLAYTKWKLDQAALALGLDL